MRSENILDQRPWMLFTSIALDSDALFMTNSVFFKIQSKNSGKTPALNIRYFLNMMTSSNLISRYETPKDKVGTVIPPDGGVLTIRTPNFAWIKDAIQRKDMSSYYVCLVSKICG